MSDTTTVTVVSDGRLAWRFVPDEHDPYWQADTQNGVRERFAYRGEPHFDALNALLAAQQRAQALEEDAKRLDWLLPIIMGESDAEADARMQRLAGALLLGKVGREAIDAARPEAP